MAPTIFQGHNKMRIFQEEIVGPVVAVTGFEDYDEAIEIANDTPYGLGAGRGVGFSLEGPTGFRFLIRSRLFTDDEYAELGEPRPSVGAV